MEAHELTKTKVHDVVSSNHHERLTFEEFFGIFYSACCSKFFFFMDVFYMHAVHAAIAERRFYLPSKIAKGKHDVIEPLDSKMFHQMHKRGFIEERNHGLRSIKGEGTEPGSLAAAHYACFHPV